MADDNRKNTQEDLQNATAVSDGLKQQFLIKAVIGGLILFIIGGVIGGIIGYSISDSNNSNNSNGGSGSTNNGCTPSPTITITSSPSMSPTMNPTISPTGSGNEFIEDEFTYPIYDYYLDNVDYSLYGQWETVYAGGKSPVNGSNIGMQSIHTVVLPNNKVLMVNGGSNRGLISWGKNFSQIDWDKTDWYYKLVNNNGLYDVSKNEFHRIPHPLINLGYPGCEECWFYPNDLFCSGQNHVRDGNVLFTGGTEWYGETFTGPKTTYIYNWTFGDTVDWNEFDWTINPNNTEYTYNIADNLWLFSGWMKEGRWYPRTVELNDGRLVVVSGITDFNAITYPSQISKYIELFDYDVWLKYFKQNNISLINDYNNPPQWKSLDMTQIDYSPLNTRLDKYPSSDWVQWVCDWGEGWSDNPNQCIPAYGVTVSNTTMANMSSYANTCEALKNDSVRLYPQMYLLNDQDSNDPRILITGGGSLWWLTNCFNGSSGAPRQTKNSYIFKISGTKDEPIITFESTQPKHYENVTRYSTSTVDPNNSSRILNFGGHRMHTYGGTIPGWISSSKYGEVGQPYSTVWGGSGRGTRLMEIYNIPSTSNEIGNWTEPIYDYLGVSWEKDRLMHFSTLLPTKEILIIGGTNYKYYGAVKSPLLLTPKYDDNGMFTGEYRRRFMTDCRWQRSYHSVAVLLQDGRVLTAGGNSAPNGVLYNAPISLNVTNMTDVSRQPIPNLVVNRFGYFGGNGSFEEGYAQVPGELYQIEIFSPPYLFIDGDRRTNITDLIWNDLPSNNNITGEVNYYGSNYYLIHSLYIYTLYLTDLPIECNNDNSSITLIKLSSSSHGWDAGQRLFSLEIINSTDDSVTFLTPNATEYNIVPAFYHLFFVDCRGKPSVALSVRFDDAATHPLWS